MAAAPWIALFGYVVLLALLLAAALLALLLGHRRNAVQLAGIAVGSPLALCLAAVGYVWLKGLAGLLDFTIFRWAKNPLLSQFIDDPHFVLNWGVAGVILGAWLGMRLASKLFT